MSMSKKVLQEFLLPGQNTKDTQLHAWQDIHHRMIDDVSIFSTQLPVLTNTSNSHLSGA